MGKVSIRIKDNSYTQLQLFDLVEISSFGRRTDFYRPISWRLRTGLERQWTNGENELVSHANGGFGLTFSVLGDINFFTFLQARLENNQQFERVVELASGAAVGFFCRMRKMLGFFK